MTDKSNWQHATFDEDFNVIPVNEEQEYKVLERVQINDHLFIELHFVGTINHMGSWDVHWLHSKSPLYGKNNYFHTYAEAREFYDLWKVELSKFYLCEESKDGPTCMGNRTTYYGE
jgi:hypothetical protein